MMKNKTGIGLIFFLSCMMLAGSARAQQVAHIYRDSILAKLPGYVPALIKMDSMRTAYTDEIKMQGGKVNAKLQQLVKPYNPGTGELLDSVKKRMSPADTAKLSLILEENRLVTDRSLMYENTLNDFYASRIEPALERVNKAIDTYARAARLDYVFVMEEMGKSLAWTNKGRNITGEIIRRIIAGN